MFLQAHEKKPTDKKIKAVKVKTESSIASNVVEEVNSGQILTTIVGY